MKKIYNLFIKTTACVLAMLLTYSVSFAQCPAGQTRIEVEYTAGTAGTPDFNDENAWLLWDATAGADLICSAQGPATGVSSACVTDGNDIEFHAFDSFGDAWNGTVVNVEIRIAEDGSVNGCAMPIAGNASGNGAVIYSGNPVPVNPPGGAFTYTCGAGAPAGIVDPGTQFAAGCATCDLTNCEVPAIPIVVETDPGTCEATVDVPLPEISGLNCEIIGFPADPMVLHSGATTTVNGATSLMVTPFTIGGVAPIDPALSCVSTVDLVMNYLGDFDFFFEATDVFGEDGNVIGQIGPGSGQCAQASNTFTIDRALYDMWAADGVINLVLDENIQVNTGTLCGQPTTIQGDVVAATTCVPFAILETGLPFTGSVTLGQGTTCFTLVSTGSGSGGQFPINCPRKIIVEDNELPTLTCPGDFTFNLQGGECEQIYDCIITAADNCPAPAGPAEVRPEATFFGDVMGCLGSPNFIINCPVSEEATIQEIDIAAIGPIITVTHARFIEFNRDNSMTVNFYEAPAGLVAAGQPLPNNINANGGTLVATSGEIDPTVLGGGFNSIVTVPMFTVGAFPGPYVVNTATTGLYMEVIGETNVKNFATSCNGIAATGFETFLASTGCGSGYQNTLLGGQPFDAAFDVVAAINELVITPAATNMFACGDALPIGIHSYGFSTVDASGNAAECEFEITVNGVPEDQILTSLACNDLVNISLDENCETFISPDMFLEGGPYACYFDGRYEVYIDNYMGGTVDATGATLELPIGLHTVTVTDVVAQNSCWGQILVEDKIAPVFPVADFEVSCKDPNIGNYLTTIGGPGDQDIAIGGARIPQASSGTGGFFTPRERFSFDVDLGCSVAAIVEDINFSMNLNHTFLADLEISLISPSGIQVNLMFDDCGGQNDLNVTFDDQAGPFNCGQINAGVSMQSLDGTLADFNGEGVEGTWILEYKDDAGGDIGVWNSASISFNDGFVVCGLITAEEYLSQGLSPCNIVDLEVFGEEAFGNQCDGESIVRTWVATDAAGNTSSATQTVTRTRIGVADLGTEWFWPINEVNMTCDADVSPDAIYAYFRGIWEANNPCPLPTCDPNDGHNYDAGFVAQWEATANSRGVVYAYPRCLNNDGVTYRSFIDNACNVIFTYTDQYLSVCGTGCAGNSKVIRTWTALDWCTAETDNSGVQIIHAKDNTPPTMQPFAPMTVSANPWGCAAEFRFPHPIHLDDNCSDVVTYRVYGEPSQVPNNDDLIIDGPKLLRDFDDEIVYDANGQPIWVVSNLVKRMEPYRFIYEISDCCGNLNTYDLYVTVVDNNSPTALTTQNIVINLTSSPNDPEGGVAKLYVESVDNGSHDGDCGPVRLAIRRVDSKEDADDDDVEGICGNVGENLHNNNSTFFNFNDFPQPLQPENHAKDDTDEGLFVKFCCDDLTLPDDEGRRGYDTDGDGINDYVEIDVELGVWDDANMDGVPGTPGDLFNLAWATVRVEAKLSPTITCPPLVKITCDMDEKDLNMTGRAYAGSTCGALDVVYHDLCGLDINQDGEIAAFTVTNPSGMTINEEGMCTDVNGDGFVRNYVAPWWSTVNEDLFNKACHYGPITRWWYIEGTEVACRQIIVVERPFSFQNFDGTTDIDWPYSEDEFIELEENDGDNCGLEEVGSADIEQYNIFGEPISGNDIPVYAEVRLSCVDGLCDVPAWVDATCGLIGWTLDSDTFYFEGDACRKIINEYTVIDWCQYQPNNPNSGGIWTWTVIGKLLDVIPPVVTATDSMFAAQPGSGGSGTSVNNQNCVGTGIAMKATAYDNNVDYDGNVIENACPSEWLKWNVYLDINNDWRFEREWSSFVAQDQGIPFDPLWSEDNAADNLAVYGYLIPDVRVGNKIDNQNPFEVDNNIGFAATAPNFMYQINIPDAIPADCGETTHRVVWKVYDGCGNVTSTTSYFTVQDKKAPTPYCINLSTALMADPDGAGPEGPMVELWAIDFDRGSFDNCVDYEELCFTFSDVHPDNDPDYNPALRSSAKVFNCDYLNGTSSATITQGVYVWDKCGNYDFCQVNLRLVDNNTNGNGCGGSGTGTGSIAGTIETEFGQTIESVEVMNMEMLSESETMDMTENDGEYAFYGNTLNMDYQLTASKDGEYLNGVSTLDLVLIQRHILGLESLDSPYKMIAADVNKDGSVTALDLVELRKLILGIYDELPSNTSWRFAKAGATLDINNPWNFDEAIDIYGLTADRMDENFIGIKIGDVNQSVIANAQSGSSEIKSSATVSIDFEDIQVEAGQTVDLVVNGDNFNEVFGYQFTLDAQGLDLVSVQSGAVKVSEENFGKINNVITTSWNSQEAINATGELFTMTLKANTSGKLSEIININSDVTKAEAYVGESLDIVDIAMNNVTAGTADFALMQNEPNPFTTNTVIGFVMPEAADARLSIVDLTGKVVKTITGNYAKGYNEIELSKSDLGAAGVYHYQLESGEFTATKKMIIIE